MVLALTETVLFVVSHSGTDGLVPLASGPVHGG